MTKKTSKLGSNSGQAMPDRRNVLLGGASLIALLGGSALKSALAQQPEPTPATASAGAKPNILIL